MASVHAEPTTKAVGQTSTSENAVAGHLCVHRCIDVAFKVGVHSNRPPGLDGTTAINACTVEGNSRHPSVPKGPTKHTAAVGEVRYGLLSVGLQFMVHVYLLKGLLLSCNYVSPDLYESPVKLPTQRC